MERLNSGWERGGKSTKPAMKGTKSLEEKLKGTDFKILEICIEKKKKEREMEVGQSLCFWFVYTICVCMYIRYVCLSITLLSPSLPLSLKLPLLPPTTTTTPSFASSIISSMEFSIWLMTPRFPRAAALIQREQAVMEARIGSSGRLIRSSLAQRRKSG